MSKRDGNAAQLDALRLSKAVRQRLVEFSCDDRFARDAKLSQICSDIWTGAPNDGGLLSDLWVEGAFPAKLSDSTLGTLVNSGIFDPDLARILDEAGAMPASRLLYEHQKESIQRCQELGETGAKPAMVVTAGTGAGKTECFLLPILNDLFRNDRVGKGMKCLILYPMNALVNDQVDRLYSWLRGQSKVRLFHFTSETPEDKKAADYDRVPNWADCRFRTRQEARGLENRAGKKIDDGPLPDIVITNYSMLEYMLCRPQDAVFFGDALRAIVLDEAHLYMGTLAAEITLLLRRLYARCGVHPANLLQIATSATLGSGSREELRDFAATIFTKEPPDVHVIVGESERAPLGNPLPPATPVTTDAIVGAKWIDRPFVVVNRSGEVELAQSGDCCEQLVLHLNALTSHKGAANEDIPTRLLSDVLTHAPIVHRLEDVLWNRRRLPLAELSRALWDDVGLNAQQATISLLQLTASARPTVSSYPIVPHRIHLLVRPTDGLSVCLNRECSGPTKFHLPPLGAVSAGVLEKCPYCAAAMMLLYRCGNCGEWVLAAVLSDNKFLPTVADVTRLSFVGVDVPSNGTQLTLTINVGTGERSGSGGAGIQATAISSCPSCGEDCTSFQPFGSGPPLTLAILAESLLSELPPFPAAHNAFLPARGRRLLAFSDSRQEAARLGPRLTRQHETQLVRAAITQGLSEQLAADTETLQFLRDEITRLKQKLKTSLSPALQQKLERDIREQEKQLISHEAGGNLSDWATAIGNNRLLAELLDPDTGLGHLATEQQSDGSIREWSQRDWEKNWARVKAKTITLLGREFATPSWRAISTETLGLAEITYSGLDDVQIPASLVGVMGDDDTRAALSSIWGDLLRALCDTLRVEGIITFGSTDDDWAFQTGGVPIGRWSAKHDQGAQLLRFVGQTQQQSRRRFVSSVLSAIRPGIANPEELAREILEAIFDQLAALAKPVGQVAGPDQLPWLEYDERQSYEGSSALAIRIIFHELGLRRPSSLFRCEKTGHVWCRSVAGCAPEIGCIGTLEPVTDEQLDADPRLGRLRHEYRSSPVFSIGLWAEEHSAQLSPQQNRRLQDLFKSGIRNILSATTTLELGIDIGGLSAVLLGNVPPGKANYLQRAGRAGRRADGSAAVVTFARPRPFDREVFRRFGDYLDKPLRKPRVFLDRQRVVRRHLHAYLLGEFFRAMYGPADRKGAMDAFGSMGRFCGKPVVPYWKDKKELPTLPDAPPSLEAKFRQRLFELRDYGDAEVQDTITNLFAHSGLAPAVDDWPALIQTAIDDFTRSIQDWNDDYELLRKAWTEAVGQANKAQANAIRYQLKMLSELTVIEALADRQFLPSYGFPIGLQKLRVIAPDEKDATRVREEDQFRLERSGVLAIAEYVPGSQLLAAGKLITSHGVLKHWTGASLDSSPGLQGQFCRCENDHWYYWIAGEPDKCPICDGRPKHPPQMLLFVKHGFTSAAWDPPKWSTDVERVGSAETLCISFRAHAQPSGYLVDDKFAGVPGIRAEYREDGELLVFNRGENQSGFSICLRCGYADSEPMAKGSGKMNLPTSFLRHAPVTSSKPWDNCWRDGDRTPVLRNQILAARETTDVMLLDFTNCLGHLAADDSLMTTLGYAFRNATARLLELDPRELGVLIVPTGPAGATRGVVLYDNVSGGAGHVRELMAQGPDLMRTAHQVLFVDDEHHQRCETGCLDCLLSFDAQRAMVDRPFARRQAHQCLTRIVEQVS